LGTRHRTHTGEVTVRALHGVDLDIRRGEFIALLGPSGSGKSTLLNILGGLDVPSEGTLWFGEQRLDGAGEAALTAYRREHVGFVFQFYNLIPSLTVRENVALVTDIARQPDAGGRGGGPSGLGRAGGSLSGPTVRRRAAARGHRAGHRQAARGAAVR
jgi:putative ABC transport system ATP-binding protein